MYNIETSDVPLAVDDDTRTTHVTTASDHAHVAILERNEIGDLALLEVELNGVVDFDGWVGITDGATVMSDDVGNTLRAKRDFLHFQEFVGRFLGGDAVDGKAALDVVQEAKVLAGLLD